MKHSGFGRRSALALLASAASAAGIGANAQDKPSPTFQSILDGAKAERRLVVWSSLPSTTEATQALIAAFNKRFGLTTELEWLPVNAVAANTRTIAEAASGKVNIDIIGGAAADEVYSLKSRGLVSPFDWTQALGGALPGVADRVADVLPELRGYAVAYAAVLYCLVYNPAMIPEDQLPVRMADLTEPKWKGRVAWNSFNLTPLDFLSYSIGTDAALDLAKKVVDNRPILEAGTPAVTRAVSAGTVALGVANSTAAYNAMRNGEPVKTRVFADFIPVSQLHLYVPNKSLHPNTARLFAAWMAAEGLPTIADIEPVWRASDPRNPIFPAVEDAQKRGAQIVRVQTLAQLDAAVGLRDKIAELVNGAR